MALPKPIPYSPEELDELLVLDHCTGSLTWRHPEQHPKRRSTVRTKYRQIRIHGVIYQVHRLVWIMANRRAIPDDMEIDHANRDPQDCRPENLRLVSHSQNNANRGMQRNNSTGFKGVQRDRKKFQASIKLNRKVHRLGCFSNAVEAARAYDRAALELFGEHALTNEAMGLLPTALAISAVQKMPALATEQLVHQQPARASQSYPGVPDLPPAMQPSIRNLVPVWTRPAQRLALSALAA